MREIGNFLEFCMRVLRDSWVIDEPQSQSVGGGGSSLDLNSSLVHRSDFPITDEVIHHSCLHENDK